MAKNDWIVAGINNPDFTASDFSDIAGLTVDNTQLLSAEDYLKSDFIKNNPLFKDDKGNFSEQKFRDYYNARVRDFGEFQQGDYAKGPALDMFDIDRTPDSKIRNIGFDIKRGVNPDRQTIGIEGVNVWGDPVFSQREIAKQNKVFDTATGEYRDYTVNDHTLVTSPVNWVKDLFKDPLVLATWDEDGTHIDPITGLEKEHKRGDAKLNDKGTYYYETLNGRSVMGKDVLSVFDTFTVDGQGLNKYDFFDSNDIKKSVAGTIAKNVATLLPLFMGPVGQWYATALIAREMVKSLPMLYGFVTAFTPSETPAVFNWAATIGDRWTTSTSDYAKQSTFAFENFGNLVGDVALHWSQQRRIAEFFGKFKGANTAISDAEKKATAQFMAKRDQFVGREADLMEICRRMYVEPAAKLASKQGQLGRDMSLAYMAIISNTDVYEDMLEHGTTKKEAAITALGSTLGMFAVDKYLHLGEVFFDEATPDATKQARRALREEFKKARASFDNIAQTDMPARNKLLTYMKKASDVSKKVFTKFGEDLKYHSLGMLGKMVGEGLEEVSEEIVTDFAKSLYESAQDFGFDTSTRDVGAWDNAFERYLMNFLGGAIGGGVFYGKEVWDNKSFRRPKNDEDIATLIRNGHVDELRSQLETMHSEGKTGNKKLLAINPEVITEDGKDKVVWKTTADESLSQAQAVKNFVGDKINSIEEILRGNNVNLSDDELFDNMVLSEDRYRRYKAIAPLTDYYQDFATVLNSLVQAELDLKAAGKTIQGTKDGTPIPNDTFLGHMTETQAAERTRNLAVLQADVEKARNAVQTFLSGENSLDYTRKLNFLMDPMLHSAFLSVNKDEYLKELYPGKTIEDLTPEEQLQFEAVQWPEYVQTQLKAKATDAWDKFKGFESIVDPHLDNLKQDTPEYRRWAENIQGLFASDFLKNLHLSYKGYGDKLDDESDEAYENRNKQIINPATGVLETTDEFAERTARRNAAIIDYNEKQDQIWADRVMDELQRVNMTVDPSTARVLKRMLPTLIISEAGDREYRGRPRSVIDRKIQEGTTNPALRNILSALKIDLSNANELSEVAHDSIKNNVTGTVTNILNSISDITLTNASGEVQTIADYIQDHPDLEGATIGELINSLRSFNEEIEGETEEEDEYNFLPTRKSISEAIATLEAAVNSGIQGIADLDASVVANQENDANGLLGEEIERQTEERFNPQQNQINSIVASIRNNPLFKLQATLKTSLRNPIGELTKAVATANGDIVPDIDNILDVIQDNFDDIDDAGQLILNDPQREGLEKAKTYLKMLSTYIYAASTVPSTNAPIGHNKTINSFAETHADKLRSPWQKLPEIDSDFALMYMQTIDNYINEIDFWMQMSDENSVNKVRKVVRTDSVTCTTLWNVLASIPRNFNYNGHTYDILSGIEQIDQSQLKGELAQIPLYNLERAIYRNVAKIAEENNMTVVQLVATSDILDTLVPGIRQLNNQRGSDITDSLTSESFTTFDRLKYIITLITEDPAVFYSKLKQRVVTNEEVAPVITQELSVRIGRASMNQPFREIFAFAKSIMSNQETEMLPNTTIITGAAGAGKTQVVLAAIDQDIKDQPVLIAGPTEQQAVNLQKALGRDSSMTFQELMDTILGKEQYTKVRASLGVAAGDTISSDYFTGYIGSDGLRKLKLKTDSITFNTVEKPPKAIYLDEATHLSTLEAQIIAAYAEKVGAQVFMCGDLVQIGYANSTNEIQNIDEGAVFAVRTPELTISFRDNNIQKAQNQDNVRALLKQILEKRQYSPEDEYRDFFPIAKNVLSVLNFRVYKDMELNGDLITKALDDSTIALIKKAQEANKTVAFIGSTSSAHLAKLRENGINIDAKDVLSVGTMQGQEYDLVVIDHDFKAPDDINTARLFTQELYTLMSRAKEASIFIDNGLSSIIGTNLVSKNKSKAPSIRESAEQLRNQKLEILNQLDLTGVVVNAPTPAGTTTSSSIRNPEEDFHDPEDRTDSGLADAIKGLVSEDSDNTDTDLPVGITDFGDLTGFPIECYGDTTFLSVNEKDTGNQYATWEVTVPEGDSELRNLQAIVPNGTTATKYNDKIALQKHLARVKSAILFQHTWGSRTSSSSMPSEITDNFTKEDWEKGTYELEFRRPSEQDVLPIGSPFKEKGFSYKNQNLIVNVVFKVKNRQGRWCKFDLAGINSPKTLIDNKTKIRDNLQKRINNPKTHNVNKQRLQGMLKNIDNSILAYQAWFDQQLDLFNSQGSLSIDVSNAIRHTKTTWFRKRPGDTIRLGGTIDPSNPTAAPNRQNLIDLNPDKVFSPIYTFTGNEAEFNNLDMSIKGKAVILVSSDCLLSPGELLPRYIAQRKALLSGNPNEIGAPEVRMIVLGNYGMTFSQLNSSEFAKAFQKGKEDRVPCRQNFTGIRMFTSLWNARAALIQFNEAVTTWKSDHNLDDAKVEALTKAQNEKYNGASDSEVNRILTAAKLSEKDLDLLDELNNTRCKDIPTFRLGYSTSSFGHHIQRFNVKGSTMYDSDEANLCVISVEKAIQYQNMLNAIIKPICPPEGTSGIEVAGTLDTKLRKVIPDPKDPRKNIEVTWAPNEFIDLKEAGHRRTLSGLLSKEGNTLIIAQGNQELAYADDAEWSAIPGLVSRFARVVHYYQTETYEVPDPNHPGETITVHGTPDERNLYNVKYRYKPTNEAADQSSDEWKNVDFSVADFFGPNGYLKETVPGEEIDHSLDQMLNLIFHGTNEDVHREYSEDNPLMQLDDAYFKEGFFINPDLSRKKASSGDWDIVQYKDSKGTTLFFEIGTPPGLFTVDVDLRSAGLQLSLAELINPTITITTVGGTTEEGRSAEEEKSAEEETFRTEYPEGAKIIDLLNGRGSEYKYNLDDLEDAATQYNRSQAGGLSVSLETNTPEEVLDTPFFFDIDSYKLLSYREYLLHIYPNSTIDIQNDSILITTAEGNLLKVNSEGKPILISKASPVHATSASRFDREYNGTTVGLYLSGMLDPRTEEGNNFIQKAMQYGASQDTINAFAQSISDVIREGSQLEDNDEQPILDALSNIKSNDDYEPIITALINSDESLYDIIFENC